MKDIVTLGKVGWLEILLACLMILVRYNFKGIPCSFIFLLVLLGIALYRLKKKKRNPYVPARLPILVLGIYMLLHDCVWCFIVPDVPGSFINNRIVQYLTFVALLLFYRVTDASRFKNAINWVALICLCGMIYHCILLARGEFIRPLNIPFLPFDITRTEESFTEYFRPTSFFIEPQYYTSFMLLPLWMALTEKKYIWAGLLSIGMLLSTSTTAIVVTFLMIFVYALTQRIPKRYTIGLIIGAFVLSYGYTHLEYFSKGMEKAETQDYETNERLSNGPNLVKTMQPVDWLLGVPYISPSQYVKNGGGTSDVINRGGDGIFAPIFWNILLMFGVLGLLFYLLVYYKMARYDKSLYPIVACNLVMMFSNSDTFGAYYLFSITAMLVFSPYFKRIKYETYEE